jgi:hypothetical protein
MSKINFGGDYEITKPKIKKSSDMYPFLLVEPTKVDYIKTVNICLLFNKLLC